MNIFRTRTSRQPDRELAAEVAASIGFADTSDRALMCDNAARLAAAGVTQTRSAPAPTAQPSMPALGSDGRRNSRPRARTATQGNNVVAMRRNQPPPPPANARPTWLTKSA